MSKLHAMLEPDQLGVLNVAPCGPAGEKKI